MIIILKDFMSPALGFEDIADKFFEEMIQAGCQVFESSELDKVAGT